MSQENADRDELRPEYDFSHARRGRHAQRFSTDTAQPEPDWFRDAAAYDEHAWLGEALRRTQELEGLLVVYLVLAFQLDPPAAARDVAELLEETDSPTLKQIAKDFGDHSISLSEQVRDHLRSVSRERNWLVHRSLQLQPEAPEIERSKRFVGRLQRLSLEAAQLVDELQSLMLDRFIRSGMTQSEFRDRKEAVIHEWLAA